MTSVRPARVIWVASPPPGTGLHPPRPARRPYQGPPAYPAPPRWGFPQLTWRWPRLVPGIRLAPAHSPERVRAASRLALALLVLVTVAAMLSVAAEIWRYALLVVSRDTLLPAGTVAVSDALTDLAGTFEVLLALAAAGACLAWILRARQAAAQSSGRAPARPDWQVFAGLLVPGPNLVMPYSVLGELEQAVLCRTGPPRPSLMVRYWWLAWVVDAVLFAVTLAWNFRDGVQAQADGVVLHAALDTSAAAVAILTGLVVWRTTRLLVSPGTRSLRHAKVVRVDGAPQPPPRAERPTGAVR